MYEISVTLKRSHSASMRNYLLKLGFVVYQMNRWTLALSENGKRLSDEEIKAEDSIISPFTSDFDDSQYICVYNSKERPEFIDYILKKLEESAVVIKYNIKKN